MSGVDPIECKSSHFYTFSLLRCTSPKGSLGSVVYRINSKQVKANIWTFLALSGAQEFVCPSVCTVLTCLIVPKTLEYRTGRKPLFWSICMPELAWKKCKQTAFYHSLYSNFLEHTHFCWFRKQKNSRSGFVTHELNS